MARLNDDPWKWAPIICLSPLPWAYISLFIIIWGQPVLRGAAKECVNPSQETIDTSAMSSGLTLAVVLAYLFLMTFAWVFLGHCVYGWLPVREDKKWSLQRRRLLHPFTSLRTVAAIYGVLMLLAFAAVAMLSSGVAAASATCADQTPLLISFSTFVMILGWVSLSVTAGRLFTVVYGGRVKEVLKEKGLAGEEGPKTDVDMLGTIFKQFDKSGDGHMEAEELAPFLEALGMDVDDDELPDILAEIDKDGQGSITLREFEIWYMKDKSSREAAKQ